MNEVVPILGGLVAGMLLHLLPVRFRVLAGIMAALGVGFAATVITGEYKVSWEFLLFDVPLASLCLVGGYLAAPRLSAYLARRISGAPKPNPPDRA